MCYSDTFFAFLMSKIIFFLNDRRNSFLVTSDVTHFANSTQHCYNYVTIWTSCIYLLWNNFQLFAVNLYKLSVILFIFNVHRIIQFDPLTSRKHVQFLMLNGRQECPWFTILWCVWGKLIDSLALSGVSKGFIFFWGGEGGWESSKMLKKCKQIWKKHAVE